MNEKPKSYRRPQAANRRSSGPFRSQENSICNFDQLDDASGIQISLTTIDNFDNILLKTTYPISVWFRVTFGKQVIGVSPPVEIQSRFSHAIDFTCQHIVESNEKSIEQLCQEPYVISVLNDKIGNRFPSIDAMDKVKSKMSARGRISPRGGSSGSTLQTSSDPFNSEVDLTTNVIYQTTLDPLPILLGDDLNKETLVLKPLLGYVTLMVDLRYPVVSVTSRPRNSFAHPSLTNVMSISLESLVNFDPNKLSKFSKCTGRIHFLNKETTDPSLKEIDIPTHLTFETDDFSRPLKFQPPAKRWFTLANLPGDSSLSLYRNEGDILDTKYPGMESTSVSLYDQIITSSKVDVRWYQFKRSWLSPEVQQKILEHIIKYKTWLIEIIFDRVLPKTKIENDCDAAYVAYVDVSNLLHPGINSTRVIAHLWSYNVEQIEEKTGIKCIMPEPIHSKSSTSLMERKFYTKSALQVKQSSETITVPKNSRASKKKLSRVIEEPGFGMPGGADQFKNAGQHDPKEIVEDRKPVFVILQVEFFKSLIPRKPPIDKKMVLAQGTPDTKLEEFQKVTLQRKAWYIFKTNIQVISDAIQREFERFQNTSEGSYEDPLTCPTTTNSRSYMIADPGSSVYVKAALDQRDFFDWLVHSPEYGNIQDLLKITMINYAKNFMTVPRMYKDDDVLMFQSNLYSSAISDVHSVLNDIMYNTDDQSDGDLCFSSSEELYFNAVEWSDKGDFEHSQSLLLKRIFFYGELNADLWIDLAVICLHNGRKLEAKNALSHALTMSPRSRDALVMYAALMHMEGQYNAAEVFYNSLTHFYPRFYQGWLILNVYYSVIENQEGRDITLAMASKCLADLPQPDPPMEYRKNSHCWTTDLVEEDDAYIDTAVYLLSLSLYDYVEYCLSARLIRTSQRSLAHYYYLAAAYHCQKKYAECETLLETAFRDHQDHGLYSIRGHNYYMLGDKESARIMFKCASQHPDAPDYDFLVQSRYAVDFYENDHPAEAQAIFLQLGTTYPSATTWSFLGRINFESHDLEKSEKAFNISNRIDPTYSEPWAYLAMIAVLNKKYELGEKCLSEAKKYGNLNEEVIKRVDCILNIHAGQIQQKH